MMQVMLAPGSVTTSGLGVAAASTAVPDSSSGSNVVTTGVAPDQLLVLVPRARAHLSVPATAPRVHGPVVHDLAYVGLGVPVAHHGLPAFGHSGEGVLEEVLGVLDVAGQQVRRPAQLCPKGTPPTVRSPSFQTKKPPAPAVEAVIWGIVLIGSVVLWTIVLLAIFSPNPLISAYFFLLVMFLLSLTEIRRLRGTSAR